MSVLALRAGIAARVRAHTLLVDDVFDEDDVPTGRERYARVRITGGLRDQIRLAGPSVGRQHRIWVHSIGRTAAQVALVQAAVLDQLVDWQPVVDGLTCHRIVHRASQPTETDTTVTPPLPFAVDQFDLFAQPTP